MTTIYDEQLASIGVLDEKHLANYLTAVMKKNGFTCEAVAKKSHTSESTVRNMCSAKTPNPGIFNALPVIYAAGGDPAEMLFGSKVLSSNESSINSIIAMFEQRIADKDQMHERQDEQIRAHYDQHRQDYKENVEKRLADKREIIEQQEKHIASLKKEIISARILTWICISVLVGLLIMEVMNPSLGWLRF